MPFLIAVLGILAAVSFYVIRARGTARAAAELIDAACDVRLAARRFRFQRKANMHPAECIDDARVALAGVAAAMIELDGAPTQDLQSRLALELRRNLDLTTPEADELMALGRWLTAQCGTPHAAITRLSRKLFKLAGSEAVTPLLSVVKSTLVAQGLDLSERQREALHDIRRAMNIR